MAAPRASITLDCADVERAARFWSGALRYEVQGLTPDAARLADPTSGGMDVHLRRSPAGVRRPRLPIDFRAELPEVEVKRLTALGATLVEWRYLADAYGHAADAKYAVMRDPDGHEFTVSPS